MKLAHTVHVADGAEPSRRAWFLHGIMGSQRNWRSFARGLAERFPEWSCTTVDLRNHGASGPGPAPQTLEACADDLAELAREIGAPELLCGHSFGGKVALAHAARRPAGLERVWILDCPPGQGRTEASEEGGGELARVMAAVAAIPAPLERRGEVLGLLMEQGLSRGLASWMSTNLVREGEGEGYVWAFDLDRVREMIADYWARDFFPLLEAAAGVPTFDLVRAARSDRWTPEDLRRLEAAAADRPAVRLHVLEDAAHWLHVDNPEGLAELLAGAFV